jgi:hypothetical protein
MKYQGFITERKDPSLELKAEYRCYYIPVTEHEGGWMPAGTSQEDTGYSQADMLSNVLHYQVFRPDVGGQLDDIASPDGHTVVARYWLEDDYTPPSPEEHQRRHEDAVRQLKDMDVWSDRNA